MSRVIPNHVLHVGQSVRITSQEDHVSIHPSGCSSSLSRSPKCSYFTTERCVEQSLGQSPGTGHATTPLHVPPSPNPRWQEPGKRSHNQETGHPYLTMEKTSLSNQSVTDPEPMSSQTTDVTSPSLDISLDHLNRLIQELDPTFQPLPIKTKLGSTASPSWTTHATRQVDDFPDVNSEGEQSARAFCQAANRRLPSHSTAVPSSSAKSECILVGRGAPAGNCTANGSVIFSDGSENGSYGGNIQCKIVQHHPSTSRTAHSSQPSSECVPALQRNHAPQPLLFSLGHKNTSLPLHIPGNHDRYSAASMVSNSPGSDTSYMLGSTHSLLSDSPDQSSSRSTESPFGSAGTFSNLSSPFVSSPTMHKKFFSDQTPAIAIHNQQHPSCTLKGYPGLLPSKRGHSSSCPPSGVNSTVDIPILLVNGCSEHDGGQPISSRSKHSTVKRRGSSNCNSGSAIDSLNKTSSDSLLFSPGVPVASGQPTMKFVTDTSKYWFKPHLTRDQVVELLRSKEPGAFIIRDSTSFRGSFGLAMKVPFSPSTTLGKPGEESSDHIRHFLIESSPKGVHLKGASEEPYFGSLSSLVYQHAIMPLSLPCKLAIPTNDFSDGESSPESSPETAVHELKRIAACNVFYLTSVCMETLTGSLAVQKAVSATFQMECLPTPTIVHFKASEQGITLTDVQRKLFFRRHYPLATVSFCGLDPQNRQWQKHCRSSRIFGFVAKSQTDAKDNTCHLFAEYDIVQPVAPVIGLMDSLLRSP